MPEQRLKVESGPPAHMIADADARPSQSQSDDETAGAKERAHEAVASAKDTAQEAAAQAQEIAAPAKETARDIAGQAKDHAQAAAGQAKDTAIAQIDERSTQLGRQVGSQADALDGVAEELRRQGKDGPAKIAEQAGERVKSVASYLEQADGQSIVAAASNLAHENPAAAAAAGAAAGFIAGRVIKASQNDGAPEQDAPGHPGDGST
jgi:F0F1-type ATP synthase membrane subunit b/b'